MNDAAALTLGVFGGLSGAEPPGGLATGLRDLLDHGIRVRDDGALVFTDHGSWAPPPPGNFPDYTGWECFVSSFHLEDLVPVHVEISDDGQPTIDTHGQRTLLLHGTAFAIGVSGLAMRHTPPLAVRCIVAVNDTNGTFRFHRIRPNETWHRTDLDSYHQEPVVIVDVTPRQHRARSAAAGEWPSG